MTGPGTSLKVYFLVYAALLLLLAATVAAAHLPLGRAALAMALGIAAVKAGLVMWYFMHLQSSPRLTWLAASGALVWLLILVVGVLIDYASRPWPI